MSDLESTWLGEPGARRSRTEHAAAQAAEHIDLTAADRAGHAGGTLGPEASHWARALLDISRFELARADDKANTLFASTASSPPSASGSWRAGAGRRPTWPTRPSSCSGPAA